jgi:small conductance mechanosensitive channel
VEEQLMATGSWIERIAQLGIDYGPKVVAAIAIFVIGRIVAGVVRRGIRKLMAARQLDPGLSGFTASLAYMAIMAFTVIAALAKFGVETASFVAILGAVGFAIGFALQGSLSNFASGVMILFFRPFKVGDFIDAGGVKGVVKEIAIFNTVVSTPDNVKVIVPNSKVYGDTIANYNGYDTRRIDMVAGIGYDSSIADAVRILEKLLAQDDRVLPDPAPVVAVNELADSSVNIIVRPWVKASDYWNVHNDMQRRIKEEFDKSGIEIPFPQRVVHMAAADEGAA